MLHYATNFEILFQKHIVLFFYYINILINIQKQKC